MNSTFGRIIATGGLVGALALASAAPTQAAEGRNAAFAAGVAAGALGGAVLGGGYAPGYGYPAYGYRASSGAQATRLEVANRKPRARRSTIDACLLFQQRRGARLSRRFHF
jgi:hypothetical protein